ncbi:MAG: AAA family ATPase [Solirubrobacteraceae bacterium]
MTGLPVRRASELEALPPERRWLVEGLWADQAVGIVGGEPKCCKSFLALDVAVAVASGAPCLRRYPVAQAGRVLLFAAEDALHVVRTRLAGIAAAAGVDFDALAVHVITVPLLRLDVGDHQRKLRETVEQLRPRLLILDPFVRLHRIDENAAAEVAPLLAYLRELQRRFETAVLLVHHARKGAAHARAGQALRGSSELHAWGDSNLYLRRRKDSLRLTVEHRAAASPGDLELVLRERGAALALEVVDREQQDEEVVEGLPRSPLERVAQALAAASSPVSRSQLREACRLRTASLTNALGALTAAGRIQKVEGGYVITR